jgi:hypothetical protein
LETTEIPTRSDPARRQDAGSPVKAAQPAGLAFEKFMKYVEKHFSLRVHRRDGHL